MLALRKLRNMAIRRNATSGCSSMESGAAMSEHTKEPWEVVGKQGYTVWAGDEIIVSSNLVRGSKTGKANARRIVACVNALEGVPTDFLEKYKRLDAENLAQENAHLKQQRDELLAVLKSAIPPLDLYKAYGWADREKIVGLAKSIIEKAERTS